MIPEVWEPSYPADCREAMVLDQTFSSCQCILDSKVLKVLLLTCSGAVLNNLVIISGMKSLPQAPEPLNPLST